MLNRRDIIYLYDGTFKGLMSAVFECYLNHEYPQNIEADGNEQLYIGMTGYRVATNKNHASRVEKSIKEKISPYAFGAVYRAFLSEESGIEAEIFEFIRLGLGVGASIINQLNIDCVNRVMFASKAVSQEAHLYTGFVRFSKLEGEIYYSQIEPKHNILPVIAKHFSERYASMPFLIYDKKRALCLVYNGNGTQIRDVCGEPVIKLSEDEEEYRRMWKEFFNTIEIKERHNEKCQNNHLSKRFRNNMTEFC